MLKKLNIARFFFISIPIYMLVLALFLGYPLFETNDDVYIMNVLSGNITGSAYGITSYFHALLGLLIAFLYKIVYIPWFPIFIIICSTLGQMCIYSAIYSLIIKKDTRTIISIITLVFIIPISLYTTFIPSFTTASTIIGLASIYMLYKHKFVLSILLLLLSTAIRFEGGVLSCAFWGLSYIYLHFANRPKITLKFILHGLFVCVLMLCIYASDLYIKSKIEPKDYSEFRQSQAIHNDYAIHNEASPEHKKLLENIGWDDNLYRLSRIYFSMDNRITTDSFIKLNKNAQFNTFSLKRNIQYIFMRIRDNYNLMHIVFLFAITNIAYIYIAICNKHKGVFLAIVMLLMCFICLNMLANINRMLVRSLLSFLLANILTLLLLLDDIKPKYKSLTRYDMPLDIAYFVISGILFSTSRYLIGTIIALAYIAIRNKRSFARGQLALLLAFTMLNTFSFVYTSTASIYGTYMDDIHKAKIIAESRNNIENYTNSHPNNIYVHGHNISGDSRMTKPISSGQNMLAWGGTFVHSSANILQLKRLGIANYDSSMMLKPNIYFITGASDTGNYLIQLLCDNLKNKNFDVQYTIVDSNKTLKVYKIIENK